MSGRNSGMCVQCARMRDLFVASPFNPVPIARVWDTRPSRTIYVTSQLEKEHGCRQEGVVAPAGIHSTAAWLRAEDAHLTAGFGAIFGI